MYEPVTNVTGIVSIGERNEIPETEDQEDNRNGCFHIEDQHRSMIPEKNRDGIVIYALSLIITKDCF